MHLGGVPSDKALSSLVNANNQPSEWSIQDGVYHIRPRPGQSAEWTLFVTPTIIRPTE